MSARTSLSLSAMDMKSFYTNKSCLVTGASGFLGKILVEKLLYSLPGLQKVYVIIRPQNGMDAQQRLQQLVESEVFDRIRRKFPERFEKLVAVNGNLMEPDMALSEDDQHMLKQNVHVIFHCAATVKFDEQLRISVEMNVIGTQRLIALCTGMHRLVAFVHASTAYANCERARIAENVYPPPVHPKKLIDSLQWMNDEMVDAITPSVVGRRPNTYTLTKSLAEFAIVEEANHLPMIIVRPSIIGATWKEPMPGWTDNLNGPTGLFVAVGKGVLTNMCGNMTAKADIIPVDVVSNCMIATGWYRANTSPESVPVVNCCSGRLNPLRWGFLVDYLQVFYRRVPVDNAFRYPSTHFHDHKALCNLNITLKHILPAHLIDFLCKLTGKKPRMVRIYEKLAKVTETLQYFTLREWDFQTKMMLEIQDQMSDEDKQEFAFDIRDLNWPVYIHTYMLGVKRYILKDDFNQMHIAERHMSRVKWLSILVNALCTGVAVQLTCKRQPRQRRWLIWLMAWIAQTFMFLKPNGLRLAVTEKELHQAVKAYC